MVKDSSLTVWRMIVCVSFLVSIPKMGVLQNGGFPPKQQAVL